MKEYNFLEEMQIAAALGHMTEFRLDFDDLA
jgi:hypothetical protein